MTLPGEQNNLTAECHCGNLKLTAPELPTSITRCNCSICDRLGALWAYYDSADVEITIGDLPLHSYAWGEKSIVYHRCGECGCTTHYTSSLPNDSKLTAINCRMVPAAALRNIPLRDFDGRESWKYLDE